MDNKTIELHTIATFQGKEYELENLLNNLLNKLEEKDKEIERLKVKLENKLTPDELVSMLNQELVRQNQDYKSRNEKAIKCIKDKYYKEEYERKGTFTNKLMNILQGEDKE